MYKEGGAMNTIYILSGNYVYPNNRKIINIYDSYEKAQTAIPEFKADKDWSDLKIEAWQVH